MEFLFGFLGAVLASILFAAGAVVGWKVKAYDTERTQRVTAEELTQAQKQRVLEEQQAWMSLHNYSVEDAYGVPRAPEPGKE